MAKFYVYDQFQGWRAKAYAHAANHVIAWFFRELEPGLYYYRDVHNALCQAFPSVFNHDSERGCSSFTYVSQTLAKCSPLRSEETPSSSSNNPNHIFRRHATIDGYYYNCRALSASELLRDATFEVSGSPFSDSTEYKSLPTSEHLRLSDIGSELNHYVGQEGTRRVKEHYVRDRDRAVIEKAKARFRNKNLGRLFCEGCSFDFSKSYSGVTDSLVEGHHSIPLSEIDGGLSDSNDIIVLCPNCHTVVHSRRPWLTLKQLREKLCKPKGN